jgi:hypothetical protein
MQTYTRERGIILVEEGVRCGREEGETETDTRFSTGKGTSVDGN